MFYLYKEKELIESVSMAVVSSTHTQQWNDFISSDEPYKDLEFMSLIINQHVKIVLFSLGFLQIQNPGWWQRYQSNVIICIKNDLE